ncbi:MAG TPA: hypothetical protein DF296_12420 [Candidatus Margulisbacteria bacterium]|nr:MAG: hypothetical protein A2X41_12920 [Candidatus Margulisbacteria bacterium GWE2_39_32]HCT85987.1 hypothetical protein [Candidatus Margulisiibacteriota bacterium]
MNNGGISEPFSEQRENNNGPNNNESKYRRLYESMMDGFAQVDMQGKIIEFNDAFEKMLGYSPNELLHLTYHDFTPEKWHIFETQIIKEQVLVRGYSDIYEKEYRRKDGTIFPIELRTILLADNDGKPRGMWAIVRNITERKRSNDLLKKSEARFKTIAEGSPIGIFMNEPDGTASYINPALEKILGINKEQALGKDWAENIHPEDKQYVINSFNQLIVSSIEQEIEARWLRKPDNSVRINKIHAISVRDGDQILGYIGTVEDITERKLNEEKLHESEMKFRLMFDQSPIAVSTATPDFHFTSANKAICHFLGYTEDELKKMTIQEVTYTEDIAFNDRNLNDLLNGNIDHIVMDKRYLRKDGKIVWGHLLVGKITGPDGKLLYLLTVIEDITERKKIETKLIDNEKKYRELVENANSIILRVDLNGKINFINKYGLNFFGYSKEEIIGHHGIGTIVPIRDSTNRDLSKLVSDILTNPKDFEQNINENIKRNGERVWVNWTNKVITNKKNQIVEILTIGSDITDYKRSEAALNKERDLIKRIADTSPVGINFVDKEGKVTFINNQASKIVGISQKDSIKLPYNAQILKLSKFDGTPLAEGEMPFEQVKNKLSPVENILMTIETPEGKQKFLSINATPVFSETGEFDGMVSSLEDITERKKAEEELHNYHIKLEELVKERTAKLEQANKELEAFSYSVSHDLRAPLRAINGYSEILLEDYGTSLPANSTKYLTSIIDNVHRMNQLIDDLLNLSKSSRQEVVWSTINMEELVKKVFEEQKTLLEDRNIEFSVMDLPVTRGDSSLIRQVWENLISNAIKYTKHKKTAIIEVGSFLQDNTIIYYIKDNGAGFDMTYKDKLFGVFQRLHTSAEYEGTGVGLAIVKKIIQKHNGTVWAESVVGKGATFYFTIG